MSPWLILGRPFAGHFSAACHFRIPNPFQSRAVLPSNALKGAKCSPQIPCRATRDVSSLLHLANVSRF